MDKLRQDVEYKQKMTKMLYKGNYTFQLGTKTGSYRRTQIWK